MESPKDIDMKELASQVTLEQAEEFEKNKDAEIERIAKRVISILAGYGLETTNFEYLKIRSFALNVINSAIDKLKRDSADYLDGTKPTTFGGDIGLVEETFGQYFFDTFGAFPEQIFDGVENNEKLTAYLKKLKKERAIECS